MALHPLAGKKAPPEQLIDVDALKRAYFQRHPDFSDPAREVSFGTNGHRGSAFDGTFNEEHVLAIAQAICDYRRQARITGPLFVGKDTHALSSPAEKTALEVFIANDVETFVQSGDGFTPTPAISRAIITYNHGKQQGRADGVVLTPSHNPPADGGFKYNATHGGPADTEATLWIQERANQLLRTGTAAIRRTPFSAQRCVARLHQYDFVRPYVEDLTRVIDCGLIRASGIKVGVDPLGGASLGYWGPLRQHYHLDLTVVNPSMDATFGFMTLDYDGKIRMDCSSPFVMAGSLPLRDRFDVLFGNDADADRHGIITRSSGLLNPNHFLAVAISYLLQSRLRWSSGAAIGKTLVSSSLIDRVVELAHRRLWEVPVGFKWFVPGLADGSVCFGGEESAGASFLCFDGSVWTTDKDGILMGLLAAEMTARTGKDPGALYAELAGRFQAPLYTRIDLPATPQLKARLKNLSIPEGSIGSIAGEPVVQVLTRAPGNDAPIGGLKIVTPSGWFAARPSGTEDVYKIYAESFKGQQHLDDLLTEAQRLITDLAKAA